MVIIKSKNIDVRKVTSLIAFPDSIDSISNFKENIKAYGYLEYWLGVFNTIIPNKEFNIFVNDIVELIKKKDFKKLIEIYDFFNTKIKDEKEKSALNTFVLVSFHYVNKKLNLYDKNFL